MRPEVAIRADLNQFWSVDGAVELAQYHTFLANGGAGPPPGEITEGRKGEGRFTGRDEQFAPEDARLVRRDEEP